MSQDFLLQAVIYLLAAVIAVPVAKRLGLGAVLGYLIAGVLIGPSALRLVGDQTDAMHTAEFGVIILLFLIGLEMRPALLWKMKRIFAMGGAHVTLTGTVLALGGVAAGLDWRQALAAGVILALSSTAIALQSLEEHGLLHRPAGRVAFGVLLFEDLSVIPMFALLPLLATLPVAAAEADHGSSLVHGLPVWAQALATLAAVAAVLLVNLFVTKRVFQVIARTRQREIFTAAALLIVVGVTALMQAVGLSPALGAFLAGVVLGGSEYRRELETDIEPFRGLLLGLFFITVGATIDLSTVAARPLLVLGLVAGLMVLKAGMLFGLSRLFRFETPVALGVAASLSQGSEFAFVLLAFTAGAGVLPSDLVGLLTVVVALSMATTPLVLRAYVRHADRVSRVVEQAEPEAPVFDDERPVAIIAGFGRFGQIVGRCLNANGYSTTVLESSIEQIELLRRFNRRVFYGDAGRLDLLRAAGAENAKLLVVAIDDRDRALEIVQEARQAFPELCILARAFDRRHAYELLDRGAHVVERETFEGGLALAVEALKAVGMRAYQAERAARLFRRHDERMFNALRPLWGDEERYAVATRESSPRMEDLLRSDLQRDSGVRPPDDGWDTTTLHAELREHDGRALDPEEERRSAAE
jgi:monovalent cation:proton antiporter-2 (CPA2) family protein